MLENIIYFWRKLAKRKKLDDTRHGMRRKPRAHLNFIKNEQVM